MSLDVIVDTNESLEEELDVATSSKAPLSRIATIHLRKSQHYLGEAFDKMVGEAVAKIDFNWLEYPSSIEMKTNLPVRKYDASTDSLDKHCRFEDFAVRNLENTCWIIQSVGNNAIYMARRHLVWDEFVKVHHSKEGIKLSEVREFPNQNNEGKIIIIDDVERLQGNPFEGVRSFVENMANLIAINYPDASQKAQAEHLAKETAKLARAEEILLTDQVLKILQTNKGNIAKLVDSPDYSDGVKEQLKLALDSAEQAAFYMGLHQDSFRSTPSHSR